MKLAATVTLLAVTVTMAACRSNDETCSTPEIKASSRVSQAECSCKLKAASKYLSKGDQSYLIEYWSGKRNDQPHVYLGRSYPSGQNKPLIKYNAYVAEECR
ncbi:hypothetical protein [Cognatishimia activa]|uniref:hypothetical protein n=1 Tax=Cognatishimia activa TaxID=1715691 RepID=UPI0022314603|nr:hypothetical protein [Cognatishimia activa]UZD91068.1 hypothetical protein M0D42_00185 [Cognatishimia activa]